MSLQPKSQSPSLPAPLALLVGIICIGFSAIFVKLANIPGTVSALYRVAIAVLILFPWWLLRRKQHVERRALAMVVLGGLFFALDLSMWNTGILLTSAANATLLANNAPLWVGLGALLLFREHLNIQYWIGLVIALIGMAAIVGADAWQAMSLNTGDLLAVAASFMYAAYMLITQKARASVDTLTFNTVYMLTGLGVLLVLNLALGSTLTGFSTQTWLALLGLGLISQVLGWLAINYALGHMRAAPVSVSLLGQPVVTAILGIFLLGEGLVLNQIIGGLLVLSGIYLVNRRGNNK